MEEKKYWFFGSKLNTALLLVLIILMVIAIRFMLQNKETYLPIIKKETNQEEQIKISEQKVVQQKFNLNFFKPILLNFPDSVIGECTAMGKTYFLLYRDKASNGSHVVGSAYEIYSPLGALVDTCTPNPSEEPSSFCTEFRTRPDSICKTVFASKDSIGAEEYPNGIDTYNLK